MNELFRLRLKALRKEERRTQEEMSTMLGISRSTYAEYERGKITPPLKTIEALSKHFNVSADYLMGSTNFLTHQEKVEAPNDVMDISKQMKIMLDYLQDNQSALTLDGELLDEDSRELLASSLENSLKMAKTIMKKKG